MICRTEREKMESEQENNARPTDQQSDSLRRRKKGPRNMAEREEKEAAFSPYVSYFPSSVSFKRESRSFLLMRAERGERKWRERNDMAGGGRRSR